MTSKNDVLTSILPFSHQNFCHGALLPTFPLLIGFTVITDHPSTGEVPPGRGPQCGTASVNIPINFSSQAA
jgi:hypothetical protein